jgi:tetratricopeptide (TPR) repeat protein
MSNGVMAWRPGALLSQRYALLRNLRRGARGELWLAQDLQQDRRLVACRRAPLRHRGQVTSPPRELEQLQQLRHPHLARVLGPGALEGEAAFWVEEFVEGHALDQLAVGPSPEHWGSILAQLLHVLHYLGQRAVVHRLISPSRILLQWQAGEASGQRWPVVRLLGVGRAAFWGGSLEEEYAAPEVLLGGRADTASDLFSLGVALYQVLAGRRAYAGVDPGRVLTQEPPERFPASLPAGVREVLRGLLMPERSRRFGSAQEALEALWLRMGGGREALGALAPPPSWLQGGALVGREALLQDVLRAWRQESARRWAVLGALGMGRSRFARELALRLEREGRPTIYLKVQPGGAPFLAAVALAEEVRRLLPSPSTRPTEGGLEASLVRTLGRLAQGSANAVVFLEDVEGADLYSLVVLRRWLELDGRTGVVITASAAPAGWEGLFEEIPLPPLSRAEILRFLQDRFGPVEVDAGLLEALSERSGGVPERLRALCVSLSEQRLLRQDLSGRLYLELPWDQRGALNRDTRERLETLSGEAQRLLSLLSLLGGPLRERELAGLLGRAAVSALEELTARGFVQALEGEEGAQVHPPEGLIAAMIQGRLDAGARRQHHAALGRFLVQRWARGEGGAEEAVHHLRQGELVVQARAMAQIVVQEFVRQGRWAGAWDRLRGASLWLGAEEAPEAQAGSQVTEARIAAALGDDAQAERALLLASQGEGYMARLSLLLLWERALGRGDEALERAASRLASRSRAWLGQSALARLLSALSLYARWRYEEAQAQASALSSWASSLGLPALAQRARCLEAACALRQGELVQARALLEAPPDEAEGSRRGLRLAQEGWLRALGGDLEGGAGALWEALGLLPEDGGLGCERRELLRRLARLSFVRRDLAGARAALRRWACQCAPSEEGELEALALAARVASGVRAQEALGRLEALCARLSEGGAGAARCWWVLSWVYAWRGGDGAGARARALELAGSQAGLVWELERLRVRA